MGKWFETTVKFTKTMPSGAVKKVKEKYLVMAETVAEVETRVTEEIAAFTEGEFEVDSVKKNPINEIFRNDSGERWYGAKVSFISLDEKSGQEKKTYASMYAQASSFVEAMEMVCEGMKGTLSDWELCALSESAVIDVFDEKAEADD